MSKKGSLIHEAHDCTNIGSEAIPPHILLSHDEVSDGYIGSRITDEAQRVDVRREYERSQIAREVCPEAQRL